MLTDTPKKLAAAGKIIYDNSIAHPGRRYAQVIIGASSIKGVSLRKKTEKAYIPAHSAIDSLVSCIIKKSTWSAAKTKRPVRLTEIGLIKSATAKIKVALTGIDKVLAIDELGIKPIPDHAPEMPALLDGAPAKDPAGGKIGSPAASPSLPYKEGTEFVEKAPDENIPAKTRDYLASLQEFVVSLNNQFVKFHTSQTGIAWIRSEIASLANPQSSDFKIVSTNRLDYESASGSPDAKAEPVKIKPFLPAFAEAVLSSSLYIDEQQRKQIQLVVERPEKRSLRARKVGLTLLLRSPRKAVLEGHDLRSLHEKLLKAVGPEGKIDVALRVRVFRGSVANKYPRVSTSTYSRINVIRA